MNREKAREHAQRNFQLWRLLQGQRREARIVKGGGAGSFGDRAMQGSDRQSIADAASQLTTMLKMRFVVRIAMRCVVQIAAQIAPQVKRGKDAARLRQFGRRERRFFEWPALQCAKNGLVRDAKQDAPPLQRKF